MPAPKKRDVRRGPSLQILLWSGVGLAPVTILVLLFGDSAGSLRVAVALTVLTVVLLAVSIALRPSVELLRFDIEERVLDEVEQSRAHIRDDITRAARNTHRALSERIHALTETVTVATSHIAALRAQIEDLAATAAASVPLVDEVRAGPSIGPSGGPAVVRRTETVHVTHRTTTVDAGDDSSGTVYGSRVAFDDARREYGRHGRDDGAAAVAPWAAVATGDRWASVRSDDHGRELRIGERRSTIRSDGGGTELRVEDRWAALRRGDRDRPGDDGYGESDWEATFQSLSNKNGPAALPAGPIEAPVSYLDGERGRDRHDDDRHDGDRHDRDRYDRDRHGGGRHGRDRHDRDRHDRDHLAREHHDRDYRDRDGRERDDSDRGYDRDHVRDRDRREPDHERDRYRERDHRERDHRDRGHREPDHRGQDSREPDYREWDRPARDRPDRDYPDRDYPDRDYRDRDYRDRDYSEQDRPEHIRPEPARNPYPEFGPGYGR